MGPVVGAPEGDDVVGTGVEGKGEGAVVGSDEGFIEGKLEGIAVGK